MRWKNTVLVLLLAHSGLICETVFGMRGHSWTPWCIFVKRQQLKMGIEHCGGVPVEHSTAGWSPEKLLHCGGTGTISAALDHGVKLHLRPWTFNASQAELADTFRSNDS
ncbi:hypothetical protein B0H14DRAFT_2597415 [Mycena olivaceomarginata]|nr:hypothetical protein B0H14DRAFT_2597415 [Mycena olivaceomarginata]